MTAAGSDTVRGANGARDRRRPRRGLGRAIALRLARAGVAVGVNYRERGEAADAVVGEIRAGGGRALAVRADVGDAAQVHDMVGRVTRELGPVDILVNNAGVSRPGDLAQFDSEQMEEMRRINVDGLITVTRAVVEGMKGRGFGRIVNVASIAALGDAPWPARRSTPRRRPPSWS